MIECPGCTSHGTCDVSEMLGLLPGEHFWTVCFDEDISAEDECDLCGMKRGTVENG